MKDDIPPLPDLVPKKRRHIENILPVHLAMWLDEGSGITPLERKKLSLEFERRKLLKPEVKLGVVVGSEGMTPPQFRTFQRVLPGMAATEVHFPRLPSKVYQVVKKLDIPCSLHGDPELYDYRLMLRECTVIIATPKETFRYKPGTTPELSKVLESMQGGLWDMIRFARNRSLPVKVILPDGKEV